MPPSLTRNLDVKIDSQKYEIQKSSKRSTDKVNFTSIQGVCVDASVVASTSSVSRITEAAISHPPQAGRDPELFLQRENTMPKPA